MVRNARRHRRSRGISTMEVLAGASLSVMTLGTIFTGSQAQLKALATQSTYAQSQGLTRTVIDLMSRELRMASYDPTGLALTTSGGLGCPGVKQGLVAATVTRIQFKQDLNADGVTTGPGENVTYDLASGTIRRTDGAGTPVVLADNVPSTGLAFRYFDGSNPPVELVPSGSPASLSATQRDCVAKVRVTVAANLVNANPLVTTPVKSTAESEIAIRNRSLLNF
jgi:Tfp pilus assembly protein PilW